jgi:methionine aminotransferase
MSQLAAQHGAINLSQGFPDFDGPLALREALARAVLEGHNQYAPMTGLLALRQQVANKSKALYGRTLDPETEITLTPGATEALFCAIQVLVRTGDEVVLLDPCYDSYAPSVALAGGCCVRVPLRSEDFGIDWQRLTDALTPKTRLVIINSPHNPSGALINTQDLQLLAVLLRGRNIYLLADEVYEHLVYDGQQHASVLSNEELYERAVVVSSFGKTYHVTGWKTGYAIAPAHLTRELRKAHQFVTFCGVLPIQVALAEFMTTNPQHLAELPDFYQTKRDLFRSALQASRFRLLPTAGTYFQLADYSDINPDFDDVAMAEWLTRERKVAAIPISGFYERPPQNMRLVRFCFAKREATLRAAAQRLCEV